MKNKLQQIVENVLIQQISPSVEKFLIETNVTQVSQPGMATGISPAGLSLRPNSSNLSTSPKTLKKLFKVIKTTPLITNLIQLGLIDPQQLLGASEEEQDAPVDEESQDSESEEETDE